LQFPLSYHNLALVHCQNKNRALMNKKQHLPTKTCLVCGRPFLWRKKWEKNWDEVKYCSEKCRRNKNRTASNPLEISG